MGMSGDQKRKDAQQRRIEELGSQFRKAKEDATKCRAEVDNILRAASADRQAARQELEDKFGIIQKLESENTRLRRVNEDLIEQREEKTRTCGGLTKQLGLYKTYLRLLANDEDGTTSSEVKQFARNQLMSGGHPFKISDVSPPASVASDGLEDAVRQSPASLVGRDFGNLSHNIFSSSGHGNNELSPHSLEPVSSNDIGNLGSLPDDIDIFGLMPQLDAPFEPELPDLPSFGDYDISLAQQNHQQHHNYTFQQPQHQQADMDEPTSENLPSAQHRASFPAATHEIDHHLQRTMSLPHNSVATLPDRTLPTSSSTAVQPQNKMQFGQLAIRPKRPLPADPSPSSRNQNEQQSSSHAASAGRSLVPIRRPSRASQLSPRSKTGQARKENSATNEDGDREQEVNSSDSDTGHHEEGRMRHSINDSQFRPLQKRASLGAGNIGISHFRPDSNMSNQRDQGQRVSTGRTSSMQKPSTSLTLNTGSSSVGSTEADDSIISPFSSNRSYYSTTTPDSEYQVLAEPKKLNLSRNESRQENQGSQQPAREEGTLETAIRESYAKFGLNSQHLKFCYEPQPLVPNAINLNTNWKQRSKLNDSVVEKLSRLAEEITCFIPESGGLKADKKESDLIRSICHCKPPGIDCASLRDVVKSLRSQKDVTRDESNLLDFEIYSTLIIMKRESEVEFEETIKGFSDYQGDLLGMYYSLHMFLSRLDSAWDGLHLLVLIYLLRAGAGRLLKYLVATTRPAAIELLLRRFESPEMVTKARGKMMQLVSLAGPGCAVRLPEKTPLKMLQERVVGVTKAASVATALGYGKSYQQGVRLNSIRASYPATNECPDPPESSARELSSGGQSTWRQLESGPDDGNRGAKRQCAVSERWPYASKLDIDASRQKSVDSCRMRPLRSSQDMSNACPTDANEDVMSASQMDLVANLSYGRRTGDTSTHAEQYHVPGCHDDMFSSMDENLHGNADPQAILDDDIAADLMQSDFNEFMTTNNDFSDLWGDDFNVMGSLQDGTIDPKSLAL